MRYRDLETGTYLTRDPIGYGDGPNIYCYVHCNPITQFDAFGLSTYNPKTEELDPDEHLNIYEQGGADAEDPASGLIMNYNEDQWKDMLKNAEDGYVNLPGDRRVKVDSFRKHFEGNKEILSDSQTYKDTRSAWGALQNGHMSLTEAQTIESEILDKDGTGGRGVKSWGEHWNARRALNQEGDNARIAKEYGNKMTHHIYQKLSINGVDWLRSGGTIYHGDKAKVWPVWQAKGVDKWYTKGGREIVFYNQQLLKDTRLGGTYNFGKRQETGGLHKELDIDPFTIRNDRSSPYD